MTIVKNFVKVVFPFQFDRKADINLEDVVVYTKAGNAHKLFQKIGFKNADLRKGLSDLFDTEENKSRIMMGYRMDKNVRELFDLPKKTDGTIAFYSRAGKPEEPYNVELSDICFYLFESGVGFAEVEFKHRLSDLAKVSDCNYFLSEIGDERNRFIDAQKIPAESKEEQKKEVKVPKEAFSLVSLLGKFLTYVPGVMDIYTDLSWERVYRKGMIYSYLYLEEPPLDFEEQLFRLRSNYKASYKFPQKYDNMQQDPAVLQQFENSYWTSSYNGAVNISIQTKDPKTNSFFENDFYIKMQKEYYVLYLAVLHQKYSTMKLMWEMGELDRFAPDYKVMREQLAAARKYQAEAANLKFRDFFKFPSYVQHINDYYELLCQTMCIDELYKDLSQDLNNIEELCKLYVEKIKQHETIKYKIGKAVVKTITTLVGAIIGVITLLNESWSILETTCGIPSGTFSIPVLLVTAVLAVPSMIGVVEAIGNVRELRKEGKEAEAEMPEAIKKEKNSKKNK